MSLAPGYFGSISQGSATATVQALLKVRLSSRPPSSQWSRCGLGRSRLGRGDVGGHARITPRYGPVQEGL